MTLESAIEAFRQHAQQYPQYRREFSRFNIIVECKRNYHWKANPNHIMWRKGEITFAYARLPDKTHPKGCFVIWSPTDKGSCILRSLNSFEILSIFVPPELEYE